MKEIYQLLSGALNQEMRLSQISNNLANINTPGFKRDVMTFQQELNYATASQLGSQIVEGTVNPADLAWTDVASAYTDFGRGELRPTGNPLDAAIDGAGFFTVRGDNGEVWYTRAGNFSLNDRGELVTAGGRQVLDANQNPLRLDLTQGKPQIMEDGTVLVGNNNAGKLAVVEFPNPRQLTKFGEGAMFQAPQGVTPQPVAKPALRPEMLEGSNVNTIDEMVRMIKTERSYQATQRVIQTVDELTAQRLQTARQ